VTVGTTATIDQTRAEEFTTRVLTDTAGATTTVLAFLGDRLGLFKDLAAAGPATSAELAARTGTNERYAREWLAAMFAAGYVEYDGETRRYRLPPEHRPALTDEPGPAFFGGIHQELLGLVQRVDAIANAFREGGGVPQGGYPEDVYVGMDRFTAMWHENLLLQQWIPAIPDVQTKLERGVRVADVGCGQGRALIKLVERFPRSSFVGYDVFAPNIDRAWANARAAGVADRVRFEVADAAQGLPARFDVVTTWDVIHDSVDPLGILRAIRAALAADGVYLCLDINCSDRTEENRGPLAALLYGFSILYCMTSSLAHGGEGLGTLGLHEPKLRELCAEAGFATVRRVPIENPVNSLFEIRP
jgi:SAM-dependent methyltransferase